MAKRRKRRGHAEPLDPEVVLSGGHVELPPLLELIHRVNPSGERLEPAEAERRYEVKSRLQSLLIRRFADHLSFERHPDDEAVVSLRHRLSTRDAAHAVIERLDPDARQVVREALEGALPPPRPRPARAGVSTPLPPSPDPLAEGRAALELYDYEVARALLTEAVQRSGGGVDEARALCELLVDHLCADDDALALVLPRQTLADPDVARRLAVASARSGDLDRAELLARGLSGPETADLRLLIADGAIARGEGDRARSALDEAQLADPVHPGVLEGRDRLARLEADRAAARDGELEALCVADPDSAERWARELLEAGINSAVARRIVCSADARARALRAERLLARGREALERGQLDLARSLLKQAGAAGETDPVLQQRLERLSLEREQDLLRDRIDRARSLLRAGDSRRGLGALLALPTEARAELLAERPEPLFAWFADLLAGGVGGPRAIDAAHALDEAHRQLEAGKHDAAASLLKRAPDLAQLEEAVAFVEAAEVARQQASRRRARARLDEAEEAAAQGDTTTVDRLLGHLRRSSLDPQDAERLMELRRTASDAARRRTLRTRIGALRRDGDPLAALKLAEELADGPELVQQLHAEIAEAWGIVSIAGAERAAAGVEWNPYGQLDDRVAALGPDGRWLWLGVSLGARLFLRQLDPDESAVVRTVTMKPPRPIGHCSVQVEGSSLWVFGSEAVALQLSLPELRPLRWWDLRELEPGWALDTAFVTRGGRHLWAYTDREQHEGPSLLVVNLRDPRQRRRPGDPFWMMSIPGAQGPAEVATLNLDYELKLHEGRGTVCSTQPAPGLSVDSVHVYPAGDGLLLMVADDSIETEFGRGHLVPVELRPDGTTRRGAMLEGVDADMQHDTRVAQEVERAFVLALIGDQCRLLSVAFGGGEPTEEYRVTVPNTSVLVGDPHARQVVLLSIDGDRLCCRRLGAEPTPSVAAPPRPWRQSPTAIFLCNPIAEHISEASLAMGAELSTRRSAAAAAWVAGQQDGHKDDVDGLCALVGASVTSGVCTDTQSILAFARSRHPAAPRPRMLAAQPAAQRGEWAEVRSLLGDADGSSLEDGERRHMGHLLGLALLHLGESEAAESVLRQARQIPGACQLDAVLDVVDALLDRPHDPELGQKTDARSVLEAIAAADRALQDDRPEAALAALDTLAVWRHSDPQALARMAMIAMDRAGESREAWCRATLMAAALTDSKDRGVFGQLPLGQGRQTVDVEAVRARAQALGGGPSGGV